MFNSHQGGGPSDMFMDFSKAPRRNLLPLVEERHDDIGGAARRRALCTPLQKADERLSCRPRQHGRPERHVGREEHDGVQLPWRFLAFYSSSSPCELSLGGYLIFAASSSFPASPLSLILVKNSLYLAFEGSILWLNASKSHCTPE